MAKKYKVGEVVVFMNRGMYNVSMIETVSANGYGYSTSGSSCLKRTFDRFEAHQPQYILNGWGLPEFTLGKSQRDLARDAADVIRRHRFNRENSFDFERENVERVAKANAECFKAILAKVTDLARHDALKDMWMLEYNYCTGKTDESTYKTTRQGLSKIAFA